MVGMLQCQDVKDIKGLHIARYEEHVDNLSQRQATAILES